MKRGKIYREKEAKFIIKRGKVHHKKMPLFMMNLARFSMKRIATETEKLGYLAQESAPLVSPLRVGVDNNVWDFLGLGSLGGRGGGTDAHGEISQNI